MAAKETLMKLTKDKLISALKELNSQGYSKMKKEELADALCTLVQEDSNREKIENLLGLSLNEASAVSSKAIQKKAQKESDDHLETYLKAFINLYGVIGMTKALELYNLYNKKNPMDKEKFTQRLNEIADAAYGIFVSDEFLCDETYSKNKELRNELLKSQADKPFCLPPEDRILAYADPDYFEKKGSYIFLEHYVNGLAPEKAEAICAEIQKQNFAGKSPSEIFNVFNDFEIVFDSSSQAQKGYRLIVNLINDTRLHAHRGYTNTEIAKIYDPVRNILTAGVKKDQTVRNFRKVGRNDPCPCGSGKKYKKCCGKNA